MSLNTSRLVLALTDISTTHNHIGFNKLDLIKEIHQFLKGEIDQINESILNSLSVEEELVSLVGNYIAKSGGKRIRPVLTLLSSKIFGSANENSIKLASAVEFIHMATLLHDDVVDGSKMRRFLPTANVIWGSKASILVGDFLFSQSFKFIVDTKSIDSMIVLSNASAIIAEGEVAQLSSLEQHLIITEAEYLKINNAKTAELFGAACEVGGIIANQPVKYSQALRDFGMNLGNIFQIVDDLLDYFSEVKITGKNMGDDFAEGKVTLPIIFLAKKLSSKEQDKLKVLIGAPIRTADDFLWVTGLMHKFNIKDEILAYIQSFKLSANKALASINIENQCKKYLGALIDFAANRNY